MKKIMLYTFEAILFVAALVGIDQYTKYYAATTLKENGPVVLIKNVLELSYTENRGAAFGILQNKQTFFFIIAVVFFIIAAFVFYRLPFIKKYLLFRILVLFIIAGGIGNMIDRTLNKYVVDFIFVKAINFPVFNVADCYVTISAVILAILILFVYKDDELSGMFSIKRKMVADKDERV